MMPMFAGFATGATVGLAFVLLLSMHEYATARQEWRKRHYPLTKDEAKLIGYAVIAKFERLYGPDAMALEEEVDLRYIVTEQVLEFLNGPNDHAFEEDPDRPGSCLQCKKSVCVTH